MKPLILYASKHGAAAEIARRVADKMNRPVLKPISRLNFIIKAIEEYQKKLNKSRSMDAR